MDTLKALTLSLGEVKEPVITCYRLGLILHRIYKDKTYKGESLNRLSKDYATSADYRTYIKQLKDNGILEGHPSFPDKVYRLLGRKSGDAHEIACAIDPFCYVSHLSAMSYHGLTNRIPAKLFITSPDLKHWRLKAQEQMRKDLDNDLKIYLQEKMPQLRHLKMSRIDRMEVHRHSSVHWRAYKNVHEKVFRVSTIGRTFLDMLREPILCGGMRHVIEVWEEQAQIYLQAIVNEIDKNGLPIDKVRAGYILDEKLGLTNDIVETWTEYAQRGGSRKLDPSEEYIPEWSERWCLSLNI